MATETIRWRVFLLVIEETVRTGPSVRPVPTLLPALARAGIREIVVDGEEAPPPSTRPRATPRRAA